MKEGTAGQPQAPTLARQGAGFIASGLIALAVDLGITSGLTRAFGVSAFLSRPAGIAVAMVVAWACHRRLTFAVTTAPALAEFARYAAVAWTVAAINYAIYAALLYLEGGISPEVALIIASVVAMIISFLAMKFGVFKR